MNDDHAGRGERRDRTRTHTLRQVRILRSSPTTGLFRPLTDSPHLFAKRHALDCGQSQCPVCGNPRHNPRAKGREKLTRQELRANEARRVDGWAATDPS